MKYVAGAVYEKFIDGRMRIVGSGADKDWVEDDDIVIGSRVVVKDTAGFHKRAKGKVTSIVDDRVYVMRDGASTDVYFYKEELMLEKELSALSKQEGGNHYKDMAIQPVEFITANNLGFLEGNVVKYICRHHAKNGAEDIKKAIHYCELLLQTKYGG